MINFVGAKNVAIPEGAVKKITDSSGKILWNPPTSNYRLVVTAHELPEVSRYYGGRILPDGRGCLYRTGASESLFPFYTEDDGATWNLSTFDSSAGAMYSYYMNSSGNCIAGAFNNRSFIISDNAGKNFEVSPINLTFTRNWDTVLLSDQGTGVFLSADEFMPMEYVLDNGRTQGEGQPLVGDAAWVGGSVSSNDTFFFVNRDRPGYGQVKYRVGEPYVFRSLVSGGCANNNSVLLTIPVSYQNYVQRVQYTLSPEVVENVSIPNPETRTIRGLIMNEAGFVIGIPYATTNTSIIYSTDAGLTWDTVEVLGGSWYFSSMNADGSGMIVPTGNNRTHYLRFRFEKV